MRTCVLCKKVFTEHGNNPWPLSRYGICCDRCDNTKVTMARMGMWDWQRWEPTPDGKRIGEGIDALVRELKSKWEGGVKSQKQKNNQTCRK